MRCFDGNTYCDTEYIAGDWVEEVEAQNLNLLL